MIRFCLAVTLVVLFANQQAHGRTEIKNKVGLIDRRPASSKISALCQTHTAPTDAAKANIYFLRVNEQAKTFNKKLLEIIEHQGYCGDQSGRSANSR